MAESCVVCQSQQSQAQDVFPFACAMHVERFGPVLIAAITADGNYQLALDNGAVVTFTRAQQHGTWFYLVGNVEILKPYSQAFPLGLQVHGPSILWVADVRAKTDAAPQRKQKRARA